MRIEDLQIKKNGTKLEGLKIKASNGEVGYWHSCWKSGVWIKKKKTDNHVYPIFVESLDECLNWEILKDEITEA